MKRLSWFWPAGLILGALMLASALPGQDGKAKKYALLVGVNRYEHDKLRHLEYAVNDARKLGDVLARAGFEVTVLSDETGKADPKKQPTKDNIERALTEILVKKCKGGDLVVVALAGHGLQFEKKAKDEKEDSYFCPLDARPFRTQTATLVSLGKIYQQMQESFAGMKVLLVDACRDDPDADRGARGVNASQALPPPEGVAVLFSCRAGQKAFENPKLEHGVFFYHIIKGLDGEAQDRKKQVTFTSLAGYVNQAVPDWVGKNIPGAKQSPNLKADYSTEPVLVRNVQAAVEPIAELAKKPITNSIGMKLVYISPGRFIMGSPKNENGRYDGEDEHEVQITRGFYMGAYEVIQEEYEAVMGKNPSGFSASGVGKKEVEGLDTRRLPVDRMSWKDAMEFCRELSSKQKEKEAVQVYDLPTEAEWEYACRARSKMAFHYGDSLSSRQANFDGRRTARVGSYEPNAWGLYDMHGNVWEWCKDWYTSGYYQVSPARDPQGPGTGDGRVLRGGSYLDRDARSCRSGARLNYQPGDRNIFVGFRVVLRVP